MQKSKAEVGKELWAIIRTVGKPGLATGVGTPGATVEIWLQEDRVVSSG